jgi:FtsH-binding integral membrane protein
MANAHSLGQSLPVSALGVDSRATFISRTYSHLLGAILAFTGIEVILFKTGLAETIARAMLGVSWLLVLGGFMVLSWFASRAAFSARSQGAQYAGLAAFVVGEAIIFVPMLFMANAKVPGGGLIKSAALVTILGFAGLTAVVFTTRKDFSFLRSLVHWGFVVAAVAIVASLLFGFQLGTFFSVVMVALAGGAILHDTSNVLHHFPEDRYIGASLQLFASVALLFWYVLRIFMSRD